MVRMQIPTPASTRQVLGITNRARQEIGLSEIVERMRPAGLVAATTVFQTSGGSQGDKALLLKLPACQGTLTSWFKQTPRD